MILQKVYRKLQFFVQSEKRVFALLFLIALSIVSAEIVVFDLFSEVNFYAIESWDSVEYLDAMSLLFEEFKGHPTRPIGFPIFLKLIAIISGKSFNYFIFFCSQFVLWLLTAFFIYKIIAIFKPKKMALGLAIFFQVLGAPAARMIWVMTEITYSFLLILIMYLFIKYIQTKKEALFYLMWLTLVYTILVRPPLMYSILLLIGVFFIFFALRQQYLTMIFVLILPLSAYLFQTQLVKEISGERRISYIGDITAYYYFDAYLHAKLNTNDKKGRNELWKKLHKDKRAELDLPYDNFPYLVKKKKNWIETSLYVRTEIYNDFNQYPITFLWTYGRNFFQNSVGGNYMLRKTHNNKPMLTKIYFWITRFQNLLLTFSFFISVFFFLFRFRQRTISLNIILSLLLLIIFNHVLTDPISFVQGDRFRVVIYPLYIMLFILSGALGKAEFCFKKVIN